MFVVEIGSVLDDVPLLPRPRSSATPTRTSSPASSRCGSWFTVLFANFAEAVAEGRGKAQAATLAQDPRRHDGEPRASTDGIDRARCRRPQLTLGDVVRRDRRRGDPRRRRVIEGIAIVDESAITGESAPVIRESGGDRSAVTGGTRVLSDRDRRAHHRSKPGETFLDRMIALVEGAERQKTPNEIALNILLAGLTIIFLLATRDPAAVRDLLGRRADDRRARRPARLPDPDDDRCAALGDRHRRHGPARAAQRARDVAAARSRPRATCNTLLLDKTGTITYGNRQAAEFLPLPGRRRSASSPTRPCSRASPTRRPRVARSSTLAEERYGSRRRRARRTPSSIPFTAQTRMCGRRLRRGRQSQHPQGRRRLGAALGRGARRRRCRSSSTPIVERHRRTGRTPLVVAERARQVLGVI